jgi:hypothetical protein
MAKFRTALVVRTASEYNHHNVGEQTELSSETDLLMLL